MRLADFISGNIEPILAEWKAFARTVWPGPATDPLSLRDHARDILCATAADMRSAQTAGQQSDKSMGDGDGGEASARVNGASDVHALGRVRSGFDLLAVVAEYRALRASVIRLWRASEPRPDLRDLDDLTRFNESIDQSLTEAIRSFTQQVDGWRRMFLAILGHDLRAPLNAITLSAALLSPSAELADTDTAKSAAQVSASAAAMARMIGDLLDFTASGVGAAMPLAPAEMDLHALTQEVVDEARAANPTRTLRLYAAPDDATGRWDAARVRQVISNLVGNAVQHGAADGAIDVSVTAKGEDVRLVVRNEGGPIPHDALPTLFDPLVRGASPGRECHRRPGSIGLGLYIAREIVIAHGGTIEVTSSAEQGTVFAVRLPRRGAGASGRAEGT